MSDDIPLTIDDVNAAKTRIADIAGVSADAIKVEQKDEKSSITVSFHNKDGKDVQLDAHDIMGPANNRNGFYYELNENALKTQISSDKNIVQPKPEKSINDQLIDLIAKEFGIKPEEATAQISYDKGDKAHPAHFTVKGKDAKNAETKTMLNEADLLKDGKPDADKLTAAHKNAKPEPVVVPAFDANTPESLTALKAAFGKQVDVKDGVASVHLDNTGANAEVNYKAADKMVSQLKEQGITAHAVQEKTGNGEAAVANGKYHVELAVDQLETKGADGKATGLDKEKLSKIPDALKKEPTAPEIAPLPPARVAGTATEAHITDLGKALHERNDAINKYLETHKDLSEAEKTKVSANLLTEEQIRTVQSYNNQQDRARDAGTVKEIAEAKASAKMFSEGGPKTDKDKASTDAYTNHLQTLGNAKDADKGFASIDKRSADLKAAGKSDFSQTLDKINGLKDMKKGDLQKLVADMKTDPAYKNHDLSFGTLGTKTPDAGGTAKTKETGKDGAANHK